MDTIPFSLLVKDSLDAVAILDNKLKILNYSNTLKKRYTHNDSSIDGKSFASVVPNTTKEIEITLRSCFQGAMLSAPETKFILPNGSSEWIKWKLQPIKDGMGEINGLMVTLENITNTKKYNDLLLRAELVSRTGSWEVDLLQDTVFWSPMTKIIHEVPSDYAPTIEGGINFYKEGFYRNLITKLVNNAVVDGTPWDTELIIVTQKGTEVWVRAKGETEIVNGSCIRISGTFQDINERKKAELRYKEAAERLKIATQTAIIGIWEFNIKDNELIWDDNMYLLYGIAKADFSGGYEAWEAGVHPQDKTSSAKSIADAISGVKSFDTEFRIIWPDGTIRFIKAIAKTERNEHGEATKMIGANWDITELKSTQLKLARNEESFLDSFSKSSIGMALVGLDGKWIQINQGLCDSLGYTKEELYRTTFKAITYEEDLASGLLLMQETIAGKRDGYQLEKRYCHKNGSLVYAILTVTVVRDIFGEILHFIAQVLDITARINSKKQLEKLLAVTKSQNESLLNFAHIVSHNLRSHSSNMSMLTKFLTIEKDPEELSNIHMMLLDATDSLSETIQHLNDVVHVKTDATAHMKSVNLLDIIHHIEKSIQGLLTKHEATTLIEVSPSHAAKAVPAYMESILFNLYTNALKYSYPHRKPVLKISSHIKNKKILIVFSDNGLGIDLKRHGDKLFGMYKTFHKHKEAKGIGLFITKNQIESMNGSIAVESTIAVGTTFTINLQQG